MKRPVGLKKLFYLVGIWAVATISLVQLWIFVGSNIFEYFLYRNNPVIQQAREEQTLRDISFYAWGKRVLFVVIPAATIGLALTYVIAVARRKSVHTIKIANPRSNTVSEFPVDKKDLDKAVPLAMGMVNANQFEAVTEGQEQAQIGKYYKELTETSIKLAQTAANKRIAEGTQPAALPPAESTQRVPTFQELLTRGVIAPDKPLIFGYPQTGQAKTGTWVDLFSSAVGGQSGQGKTATLRSLIAQSLISGQVSAFWIIDDHFPHPKSLLATLGPLKDLPVIKYAESRIQTIELLDEVDATITRRLQGQEPSKPIKVLVIDEVFVLCKRCPRAVEVILRIATESRKAGVYGLFSAQTWKADAVGGSEVRDCLTSRFAHKMQPKQANLLLQDSDQSKIVKELTTGNVLFVPVNGAAEILGIPYCDPRDMQAVYDLIVGGTPALKPRAEQPKLHQAKRIALPSDPDLDEFFTQQVAGVQDDTASQAETTQPSSLQERVKNLIEAKRISYGSIHKETGIGKSTAYNFVNGKGSLRDEQNTALEAYLERVEHELQRSGETPSERDERAFMNAPERAVNV